MRNDQAIDFAKPYMDAKQALSNLHDAMLHKEYDHAIKLGMNAITDIRIALAAIRHEQEMQDALRQQTETI
jgi:uncharacterized protein YjaG (DUF416 family)